MENSPFLLISVERYVSSLIEKNKKLIKKMFNVKNILKKTCLLCCKDLLYIKLGEYIHYTDVIFKLFAVKDKIIILTTKIMNNIIIKHRYVCIIINIIINLTDVKVLLRGNNVTSVKYAVDRLQFRSIFMTIFSFFSLRIKQH